MQPPLKADAADMGLKASMVDTPDIVFLTRPTALCYTARLARHGWQGFTRSTRGVQHDEIFDATDTMLTPGLPVFRVLQATVG